MKNKNLTRKERIKQRAKASREKLKKSREEFSKEFRKAINTAIVAAFGFLMALVWRDVITEYVDKISAVSPVKGKLISALIVTFVSVIGILVISRLFSVEE
ncbi:MAG: DUF5654 family protein [Nanoarchaeota archaeon]|nr:hypothetical protein [Nanoarchaeota archaeon]